MADKFDKTFIKKVGSIIEQDAVNRMSRMALRAHMRLVAATPVDLGQARAGWNFTLNRVDSTIPGKPNDGDQLPPPQSMPDKWAAKGSDFYHITNFVYHVKFLNEGHSSQAPSNFVDREVLTAFKEVNQNSEVDLRNATKGLYR